MKQTDNFKFDEANVMNELVYRNLSEDEKRQICAWKYGGEYDLYNLPSYEEMQVRQIGFMNPQREKNYYGFWDESILVGFVNILEEKEEIFIGIGVNGDEIVGFVTRGRGISIHRTDCVNIINLSKIEKDRLIEAEWQDTALMDNGAEYQADLKIFCHDRPGLLVDITKIFTEKEINISGIQSKTSKQGIATIEVFFNIKGRDQIKVLVEKLRQIESVIDVERTTG